MYQLGFHIGKLWFWTGISCPEWIVESVKIGFWREWLAYQFV